MTVKGGFSEILTQHSTKKYFWRIPLSCVRILLFACIMSKFRGEFHKICSAVVILKKEK
jgi:hypothetical protein